MDWIAEVRERRAGNHADPAATRLFEAPPLTIGLEYRVLGADRGFCIHVYGMRAGLAHERLRIDCFERLPHFHREWSAEDEFVRAPAEGRTDPWAWGLALLHKELPAIGFEGDAAPVIARLEALAAELR